MKALEVNNLVVAYGNTIAVDGVSVSLERGKSLTLLGPSGCGKTTLLRAIAGLEKPSGGSISLFGEAIFDAERRINIPTEKRNLSLMFQNYAIWPHMSVFDNVAYSLRLRKVPKAEINAKVMQALDLVGLASFAQRPATNLSGGQQQRVALARSFVFEPRIILFDEPLSNLDAKLRGQMRDEIKRIQQEIGISAVFVTHDQEEALVMSDSVLVMRGGKVEQRGTPEEVYFQPRTTFVADFVGGSNLIKFRNVSASKPGSALYDIGGVLFPGRAPGEGEDCRHVAIKTTHIQLQKDSTDDVARGNVVSRSFVGDFVNYTVLVGDVELRIRRSSTEMLNVGSTVSVKIAPEHVIPVSGDVSFS